MQRRECFNFVVPLYFIQILVSLLTVFKYYSQSTNKTISKSHFTLTGVSVTGLLYARPCRSKSIFHSSTCCLLSPNQTLCKLYSHVLFSSLRLIMPITMSVLFLCLFVNNERRIVYISNHSFNLCLVNPFALPITIKEIF